MKYIKNIDWELIIMVSMVIFVMLPIGNAIYSTYEINSTKIEYIPNYDIHQISYSCNTDIKDITAKNSSTCFKNVSYIANYTSNYINIWKPIKDLTVSAGECVKIRQTTRGELRYNTNPIDIIPSLNTNVLSTTAKVDDIFKNLISNTQDIDKQVLVYEFCNPSSKTEDLSKSLTTIYKTKTDDNITNSSLISANKWAWWNVTYPYRQDYTVNNNGLSVLYNQTRIEITNISNFGNITTSSRLIFNDTYSIPFYKDVDRIIFRTIKEIPSSSSHNYTFYWGNSSIVPEIEYHVFVDPDDIVVHYRLNENTSTTTVNNIANNSNDGATQNGNTDTFDKKGMWDGAFNFDNSNDYVLINDNLAMQRYANEGSTITGWGKQNNQHDGYIMSNWDGSSNVFYALAINSNNYNVVSLVKDTATNNVITTSPDLNSYTKWVFGVSRMNGTNQTACAFTNATNKGCGSDSSFTNLRITTDSYWVLGRLRKTSTSSAFNGIIDEVTLWDKALSEAELTDIYNDYKGVSWFGLNGSNNVTLSYNSREQSTPDKIYNVILDSPLDTTETTFTIDIDYIPRSANVSYCTILFNTSSTYYPNTTTIILNNTNTENFIFTNTNNNKNISYNVTCVLEGNYSNVSTFYLDVYVPNLTTSFIYSVNSEWGDQPSFYYCINDTHLYNRWDINLNGSSIYKEKLIQCQYGCNDDQCNAEESLTWYFIIPLFILGIGIIFKYLLSGGK